MTANIKILPAVSQNCGLVCLNLPELCNITLDFKLPHPSTFELRLFVTLILQGSRFLTDLKKINLHAEHNFKMSEDKALRSSQKRTF